MYTMVRARCLVCSRRSTAIPLILVLVLLGLGACSLCPVRRGLPRRIERNVIHSPSLAAVQERADLPSEGLQVHEKCVVSLDAGQGGKACCNSRRLEKARHRALLIH